MPGHAAPPPSALPPRHLRGCREDRAGLGDQTPCCSDGSKGDGGKGSSPRAAVCGNGPGSPAPERSIGAPGAPRLIGPSFPIAGAGLIGPSFPIAGAAGRAACGAAAAQLAGAAAAAWATSLASGGGGRDCQAEQRVISQPPKSKGGSAQAKHSRREQEQLDGGGQRAGRAQRRQISEP